MMASAAAEPPNEKNIGLDSEAPADDREVSGVSEDNSVTRLLEPLRRGDSRAIDEIWRRYFRRMSDLARKRLMGRNAAVRDEEDAALSAFETFRRRVAEGEFVWLANRDDLWRLLVHLTYKKVSNHQRHAARKKRGGGVHRVSLRQAKSELSESHGLSGIEDTRWIPTLDDDLDVRCRELLELLGDESLQQIAVCRLQGYLIPEIADRLQVAQRSIERKLARIRSIWREALDT